MFFFVGVVEVVWFGLVFCIWMERIEGVNEMVEETYLAIVEISQ